MAYGSWGFILTPAIQVWGGEAGLEPTPGY